MAHLGRRPNSQPGGRHRWCQTDPRRRTTRDGIPWAELPRIDGATIARALARRVLADECRSPWPLRRAAIACCAVGRSVSAVAALTIDGLADVADAFEDAAAGRVVREWARQRRILAGRTEGRAFADWQRVSDVLAAAAASAGGRPLRSREWASSRW